MLWLNFVHLYQPANLEADKINDATAKSYERLLRALEEHPQFKLTANIAGSLLERWSTDLERQDLIGRFRSAVKRGQLEVVGSAAYHALLPLVTAREVVAQVNEQERLLKLHFGVKRPKGFFLPELAYSPAVARQVKDLGYEWLIVDEITALGRVGEASSGIFTDKNSGLKVIIRNRAASESFVPRTVKGLFAEASRDILITASDAELYGLHHLDQTAEFEEVLKIDGIKTDTISHYIGKQQVAGTLRLQASNWQSSPKELEKGVPFALWQRPGNRVHALMWQLAGLAQELQVSCAQDGNIWWSRWHLWRGLQSCAWWWASRNDFRQVFGPLAWSPDEIERGLNELIRSVRALESSTSLETKLQAEKLAHTTRMEIWKRHWQAK